MTDNGPKAKILQVNKLYAPPYPLGGGVETVVQSLAEGLRDRCAIQVLACQTRGRTRKETVRGVTVRRSSSLGIYWSMPVSLTFPLHLFTSSRNQDILHFHLPFPLGDLSFLLSRRLKSRVSRPKIVVTWHSDIVKQQSIMKAYRPWLLRFLDCADAIVVSSSNLLKNSPYLGPFREKCRVIPLGIDRAELRPTDPQIVKRYTLPYARTVLCVGRLCYYKGIAYLLRAMRNIEANLVLVGDGGLRTELERTCAALGMEHKVKFVGSCGQLELNTWYSICDLFVLPSVEVSETFGLVQAEAMSFGKPVINTDLPTGVPQVSLHGRTGLTVPPRDADQLAAAIQTLLSNPALAQTYGEQARERAASLFTLEAMLKSYAALYTDLLRKNPRQRPEDRNPLQRKPGFPERP